MEKLKTEINRELESIINDVMFVKESTDIASNVHLSTTVLNTLLWCWRCWRIGKVYGCGYFFCMTPPKPETQIKTEIAEDGTVTLTPTPEQLKEHPEANEYVKDGCITFKLTEEQHNLLKAIHKL
jgi:hypothetical protein